MDGITFPKKLDWATVNWRFVSIPSLLVLSVGFGSYWGIYHFIDWADESFALAVPYRFFLGDRPFVDELNVAQLFSFLTYPFLHLYLSLKGDTEGLVLFFRHLWWLAHLGLFFWVRRCLRADWGEATATVVALLVLVFDPVSRRTLDYKTLYWLFFTAAILGGYAHRHTRRGVGGGVGLGLGLASFVNPGGSPVCLAYTLFQGTRRHWLPLVGYVATGLMLGGMVWWFLDASALHQIQQYHAGRGSTAAKMWERLGDVTLGTLFRNPGKKIGLLLGIGGLLMVVRRWRWAAGVALGVPLLIGLLVEDRSGFLLYLSAIGGLVLFLSRGEGEKDLLVFVWLPSVASGLFTSFLSDTGLPNASISLLPAGIASLLGLVGLARTQGFGHHWRLVAPVCGVLILLGLGTEFRSRGPTQAFAGGPFWGIQERDWIRQPVEHLQASLREYSPRGILFYGGWASFGYLLSSHRPLAPTVYRCASGDSPCFHYFSQRQEAGTLVVQWRGPRRPSPAFWRIRYNPGDSLNTLLHRDYGVVEKTSHFWIWKKKGL